MLLQSHVAFKMGHKIQTYGTCKGVMEMRWWMLICNRWRGPLLWRTFFTTAVVAVVLRTGIVWCKQGHCGLSGEGGLIIFDVSGNPQDGLQDLLTVIILGVVGGVLGSLFNQINGTIIISSKRWLKK